MSTLHALTIAQAHEQLKSKQITATELLQSCIDRIGAVDKDLNTVVTENFDRALEEAKKLDSAGDFSHPLCGIPMLVKDNFCEKGIATTSCSDILRDQDYVPPYESTTTSRLKEKGALSIGKANCDQFAMGASNETSCYGPVTNPWDTDRVPGGTSGGSAAAVAADECLFALGSDTGGSIRQPSSLCGTVGLKVTYGRTSRYGVMAMASSLDTIGAVTKTVEDAAIFLETAAGKDPMDPTTGDIPVGKYREATTKGAKGMKIGVPKEYFIDGMDPEVEQSIRDAIKTYESMGAEIVDISLPHTEFGIAAYYIIVPSEVSSNMARYDGIRYGHTTKDAEDLIDYYFKVRSAGLGDEVKRRIMLGTYALSAGYYDAYYRQAQKIRALVQKDFLDAFEDVDVILAPTSPFPAFKIGDKVDDPLQMYLADVFTVAASLAGICGLNVPCGFTKEELPIGMQLLGPHWGEESIMQAGAAYEKETEWHTRKPEL